MSSEGMLARGLGSRPYPAGLPSERQVLEAVIRGLEVAVTVETPDGWVLFANDAAARMLGFATSEEMLARPPPELADRFEVFDEQGDPLPPEELPGRRALAGEEGPEAVVRFRTRSNGEERWASIRAAPIRTAAGRVALTVTVVEDITIARALQRSLLPRELPSIPGIETAARYRPAGEGNQVGGDFYDVFETGEDGWAVVIGDVCGKGPEAAAVTALARHTVRAAAIQDRVPSHSLGVLNEALLRNRDDRRFCTVVHAYLEPTGDGADGALASGGHPLPLLLHSDGSVETVGAPGTLLGLGPDPEFEDRDLRLSRGDVLVFYTDGLTESRGESEPIDEARLAELLTVSAGSDAEAIADRLEHVALSRRPRDDLALLVLRVED